MQPALIVDGGHVRRIARIIDGELVTFVANPHDQELLLRLTPADDGPLVAWDPVLLQERALPPLPHGSSSTSAADSRVFTLRLPPFGSAFVLRGDGAPSPCARRVRRAALEGEWHWQSPGGDPVLMAPRPHLWTNLDATARGFSGIAIYRHEFTLADSDVAGAHDGGRVELEFEDVRDIARVVLNGIDCGTVWTAPFRIDVTSALRSGRNALDVHVATPWRNRLIAEATWPSGEMFEPMTSVFEPTAEALPAGIRGRVSLITTR